MFGLELLLSCIGLDEEAGLSVVGDADVLTKTQASIALGSVVEAIGVGEGVLLPTEQGDPVPDGVHQDLGVAEPREIGVPGEVFGELLDGHVIPAPQRHVVEFKAEASGGELGDEQFVVLKLAAGTNGKRFLSLQAEGLPLHRVLRLGLCGNKQPLVSLRDASADGGVGVVALTLGRAALLCVEVQRRIVSLRFLHDGIPREIMPHGFVEVDQPGAVEGEKNERVAIEAWRGAALFEHGFGNRQGRAFLILGVGEFHAENYQARI